MTLRAILVCEAWGRREEMFQHALVGASGRELARMLAEAGLAPELEMKYPNELDMIAFWRRLKENHGIAVANVFNMRPPDNNLQYFYGNDNWRNACPMPRYKASKVSGWIKPEYFDHIEQLWKFISDSKPNLVIAFGNCSCWALLGQTKITELRGSVQISERLGLKVLPTFHPANLLYPGGWMNRPVLVADLKKAAREIEFPELRRIKRWITTHDFRTGTRLTLAEIRQWFNRPATKYAIDIESGYALYDRTELKRMTPQMRYILSSLISMVGFARSPDDIISIPFMDRNLPGLNYWPDPNDEVEAWKLTLRGLKRPVEKVFQNGLYDISRFLSMGIMPTMCYRDTMLRHHALYPEQLKSLGFQGSLYSDEVSWKLMYKNKDSLKRDE
jgi:uracil-DNA glycosylase